MSAPLSEDVRALLEAIREALIVPRPAGNADHDTFLQLQRARAVCVDVHLGHALKGTSAEAVTRLIRDLIADHPVTYPVEPGSAP